MDEIKALLQSLVNVSLHAKNEAKKEDAKDVEEIAENEEVDKRDIIRQIMAIAGKEEATEDVKTIAKLAEKLAYDKSEAGTADNEEDKKDGKEAKNKCKNKEDEEEKEDKKDKVEKLEKTVDEVVENAKAKNSIEALKEIFYSGDVKAAPKYMTQAQGIELGKKLY